MAALLNGSNSGSDKPPLVLLEIDAKRISEKTGECAVTKRRKLPPPLLSGIRKGVSPDGISVVSHEPGSWFYDLGRPQQVDGSSMDYSRMEEVDPVLGSGRVDSVLVFNRDQTLHIKSGTEIEFGPNGGLLIFGRLNATGTEKAPIVMKPYSSDWLGIAIINANTASNPPSRMHHMIIEKIRRGVLGPVSKLGAIQLVRCSIDMRHLNLRDFGTEDGISFYKSYFTLENVALSGVSDDCIDSDWSWGKLKQVNISRCDGDGLDLNNTLADIEDIQILDYKDKGISIGEESSVKAKNIKVGNGSIGLAVKDLSLLYLSGKVSSTNIAHGDIELYTKNATFGNGKVYFLSKSDNQYRRLRIVNYGNDKVVKDN